MQLRYSTCRYLFLFMFGICVFTSFYHLLNKAHLSYTHMIYSADNYSPLMISNVQEQQAQVIVKQREEIERLREEKSSLRNTTILCLESRSALLQAQLSSSHQQSDNTNGHRHEQEDGIKSAAQQHVKAQQQLSQRSDTKHRQNDGQEEDSAVQDAKTGGTTASSVLELGPIFYNLFVPDYRYDDAMRIAKEQMIQRDISSSSSNESPLLYTLIGASNITDNFCQPNCKMRQYMPSDEGDEVDTLQLIWTYCHGRRRRQQQQQDDDDTNNDQIVTYLHNRVHGPPPQEKSRRFATRGALECRSLLMGQKRTTTGGDENEVSRCNACTSMFHLLPQYHGSANMWTAKCSYIRGLVEPKSYSSLMASMYEKTLLNHSDTTYACLRPQSLDENHLGVNRSAMERWLFSHPNVEPCDSMPFDHIKKIPFDLESHKHWTGQLQRAPRRRATDKLQIGTYKNSYALLAGRLYEWQYLYGRAPRNASWVWQVYKTHETGGKWWMRKCLNQTGISPENEVGTMLVRDLQPPTG